MNVIPVQTGIQRYMNSLLLDSRFRGNDREAKRGVLRHDLRPFLKALEFRINNRNNLERIMAKCKACGHSLGSNKDCPCCLEYLTVLGIESQDEESLKRSIEEGEKWQKKRGESAPKKLVDLVKVLIFMARDYYNNDYREIPWMTIGAAVFGIFYAANPFDLVPDVLPLIGWTDDVAILGIILKGIISDLRKYCDYKGFPHPSFPWGS